MYWFTVATDVRREIGVVETVPLKVAAGYELAAKTRARRLAQDMQLDVVRMDWPIRGDMVDVR